MKRPYRRFVILALVTVLVASCAPGPNMEIGTLSQHGEVAGFWLGLWHGLISPFSLFLGLFLDRVSFYEVHNNGEWYSLGFLIGVGVAYATYLSWFVSLIKAIFSKLFGWIGRRRNKSQP